MATAKMKSCVLLYRFARSFVERYKHPNLIFKEGLSLQRGGIHQRRESVHSYDYSWVSIFSSACQPFSASNMTDDDFLEISWVVFWICAREAHRRLQNLHLHARNYDEAILFMGAGLKSETRKSFKRSLRNLVNQKPLSHLIIAQTAPLWPLLWRSIPKGRLHAAEIALSSASGAVPFMLWIMTS